MNQALEILVNGGGNNWRMVEEAPAGVEGSIA